MTVEHLLTHTSGVPDYFDESVMDDYEELRIDYPDYNIRRNSDLIPLFIDKPMMYPRGERFRYNNTGYVLLAAIIDNPNGKDYAYMQGLDPGVSVIAEYNPNNAMISIMVSSYGDNVWPMMRSVRKNYY